MIRQELKEHAKTIVQIPNHFRPTIEEYFEGENSEVEEKSRLSFHSICSQNLN